MAFSISDRLKARNSRAQIISMMTCAFALLYHIAFLFVFKSLHVNPMFFYNFLSIFIFAISLAVVYKTKSAMIPYTICAIEVFVHQIYAEYYLGGDSSFRFFILIMGIIPLFVFNNKLIYCLPFSIISLILFGGMQVLSNDIPGVYQISQPALTAIKITNISLAISILFIVTLLFMFLMNKFENQLETKVSEQTKKLLSQSEQIISIQNNTILSLSNLVENRDSDTGDHVLRTSSYVKMLAKRAQQHGYYKEQLTNHYIEVLAKAAQMHDIGKIVIPDSILKKPGKLTDIEFENIKRHTTEGRRIVYDVLGNGEDLEYVNIAADVAEFHHEKWNGTGYPKGLKGHDIPLCARIMAVADVFDALVSPRCYKDPIPVDEAIELMKKSAGEHFDPTLVDCFIELKEQVIELMTIYDQ